ncbi:MAG: phosphate-binding protein, partial [Pseudomonadales bacterium]
MLRAFLQRVLALYLLIPGLGHGAALMLDEALPAYEPTQRLEAQAVTSVGSDTMNNLMSLWTEAFQAYHPGLSAQISGAG